MTPIFRFSVYRGTLVHVLLNLLCLSSFRVDSKFVSGMVTENRGYPCFPVVLLTEMIHDMTSTRSLE